MPTAGCSQEMAELFQEESSKVTPPKQCALIEALDESAVPRVKQIKGRVNKAERNLEFLFCGQLQVRTKQKNHSKDRKIRDGN